MSSPFEQHGAFSWCELTTSDVEAAKRFYGELLGWNLEDMPMEHMTYTVVKAGDTPVGGIMSTPPQAQGAPPHWGCYVTVQDVDDSGRKAESLGGKVVLAPMDIPGVGRMCMVQDPQGAVLSLITYLQR